MDCIETQEILSQAADRAPVRADLLSAAKEHCATCTTCSGFVRGLARLHRAEKPRMDAAALETLVATARTEAERVQALVAHEATRQIADVDDAAAEAAALAALADLKASEAARRPRLDFSRLSTMPLRQQAVIGSVLAAAVVFVGVVSVAGMAYLLRPTGVEQASDVAFENSTAESLEIPSTSDSMSLPPQESTQLYGEDDSAMTNHAAIESATGYLTFEGWVHQPSNASTDVDLLDLQTAGTVRSDLGEGAAASYAVWKSDDPLVIFVQAGNGELLAFERVTRRLDGVEFGLQSRDISEFGQWPTLPAGIPEPTRADGSPTFREEGTDDGGAPIFPRAGTSASQGYALAPNTSSEPASAGNESWTWWAPIPAQ